jgi:unsaturated rhamnogalacturonyl hydrolase
MAATPYLLFAGLGLEEPRYVDEAARQAFLHYEVFRDPDNGLLHQCRNFPRAPHITPDHWGRGQGWGYIALTELVRHLPDGSPHRQRAKDAFRYLSRALLPHQGPRGLWRQEVPREDAWEESSGTALILYGFGVGMRHGLLQEDDFGGAFRRGIDGLLEHCIGPDGTTHLCCPGCCCPGRGERRGTVAAYIEDKSPEDDERHSFGPLMLALVEAARRM